MTEWDTVAIVGVGLIGGSIGLAIRERGLAKQVVGIGRSQASLRAARRRGAVTRTTLDLNGGVARAALVVVCTPVGRIASDVLASARACPTGTLITDAGSTKGNIVAKLDGQIPDSVDFVGSHPLAGSEKSGPAAASGDLFIGRTAIITPTPKTRREAIEATARFWVALGANVVRMSPAEHDRAVAAISHLPHLVASALAAATPDADLRLAASGWLDTTRVAAGDPELWQQIFDANRPGVLTALERYEKVLSSLRRALERGDAKGLHEILTQAKCKRDALAS